MQDLKLELHQPKAFTCQVAVLLMMALKIGRSKRYPLYEGEQLAKWINNIPLLADEILDQNDQIKKIAKKIYKQEHAFFIGRGFYIQLH